MTIQDFELPQEPVGSDGEQLQGKRVTSLEEPQIQKASEKKENDSLLEQSVDKLIQERRDEAKRLVEAGKPLNELLTVFDNDYQLLGELYKQKTGVDLIADPYESYEHEIPIQKTCSIVMPCFNNSVRLRQALLAVQASSFNAKYPQQLEVIVVDDGSTQENIAEVVKSMELEDLTVKVYRQSNGHTTKARYTGAIQATGDIIIFSDPDVVYTPTTIEEDMKRHEVLEGVACFGLRDNIQSSDERLSAENIAHGSLAELPITYANDLRVQDENMLDSDWLKKGGKNKPLQMSIVNYEEWKIPSIAWGLSVSAPRDVFVKTMCGYDPRYAQGYYYEDENMVAELISEGLFVIPNTGGMAYHQWHPEGDHAQKKEINKKIYEENLTLPPKRQNVETPLMTDAVLEYEVKNSRSDRRDDIAIKPIDDYAHAKMLAEAGLYDNALTLFNKAESSLGEEYWLMHDKAVLLTNIGGEKNLSEAISYLQKVLVKNPTITWVHSSLAIAQGRAGNYDEARKEYEEALFLDPLNWQACIIIPPNDQNSVQWAEHLHQRGKALLDLDKQRQSMRHTEAALALVGETIQPWSLFDKGKALTELGQFEEAIAVIQRTQEIMPHETWPYSQLGVIYEQMGMKEEARKYYSEAIQRKLNNTEALEGLARVS